MALQPPGPGKPAYRVMCLECRVWGWSHEEHHCKTPAQASGGWLAPDAPEAGDLGQQDRESAIHDDFEGLIGAVFDAEAEAEWRFDDHIDLATRTQSWRTPSSSPST